jgi:hypothetical protein
MADPRRGLRGRESRKGKWLVLSCRIGRCEARRQAVRAVRNDLGPELPVSLTIANRHHYSTGTLAKGSRCESGAVAPLYSTLVRVESQTHFVIDVKP